MNQVLLFLVLFGLGSSNTAVVYDAQSDDCNALFYTERHELRIGGSTVDLTSKSSNSSCSADGTSRTLQISFGELSDEMKDVKLSYGFIVTDTGYWSSKAATLTYTNGTTETSLTGAFKVAYFIGTAFSFACTPAYTISLSSGNTSAALVIERYQIQAYMKGSVFVDEYQCINYISKGAWMGIFTGVLMIIVLVLSIMMLLSTTTPDRFETSKSKCLIIPHEH